MTKKEFILDSLVDGGVYGECETQIKEYFDFVKVSISIEEIRTQIKEMLDEGLIYANNTWKNEHGETPYLLTDKGKENWNKNNY